MSLKDVKKNQIDLIFEKYFLTFIDQDKVK